MTTDTGKPGKSLEIVTCSRCGIHLGPTSRKRVKGEWVCNYRRPCDITAGLIPPPPDRPPLLIMPN